MIEERYPTLWRLIAGDFHEDSDLYEPTWEPILQHFLVVNPPEVAADAAREIGEILRTCQGQDLRDLVFRDWVARTTRSLTVGVREWLEQIHHRLEHAADLR
jgi:hypothetical protein